MLLLKKFERQAEYSPSATFNGTFFKRLRTISYPITTILANFGEQYGVQLTPVFNM